MKQDLLCKQLAKDTFNDLNPGDYFGLSIVGQHDWLDETTAKAAKQQHQQQQIEIDGMEIEGMDIPLEIKGKN